MAQTIITILDTATKSDVVTAIQSRGYTVVDDMPLSRRNFMIDCDQSDLDDVKGVNGVQWFQQKAHLDDLQIRKLNVTKSQTINPDTSATPNGSAHNWGLARCTTINLPLPTEFHQRLSGKDINCVIIDTAVKKDHCEFTDAEGSSRLVEHQWKAGLGGSFYTDEDGHGTHVAGIMCGNTQGWARDAKIYSMKIFDADQLGTLEALQLVRQFHNGQDRPTVVNMSWGYYKWYPYNHPTKSYEDYHPYRVYSVDAEIEDMIKDGIICVGAAGNSNHIMDRKIDSHYEDKYCTSDWWGDYYVADGYWEWYPHRGSSPTSANGCIAVGASNANDERTTFSNYGGRVDVYAPGRYIQSAWIDESKASVPGNSGHGLRKLSGTSMSSPQVAGMVACMMEKIVKRNKKNSFKPKNARGKIKRLSSKNKIDTGVRELGNGKNRIAYIHSAKTTFSNGSPTITPRKYPPIRNGHMEYEISYDTMSDLED